MSTQRLYTAAANDQVVIVIKQICYKDVSMLSNTKHLKYLTV